MKMKTIGYAAFTAAIVVACAEPDESASIGAVMIYAAVFMGLMVVSLVCLTSKKKSNNHERSEQ